MERSFVYPTLSGVARDVHALAREKGFYASQAVVRDLVEKSTGQAPVGRFYVPKRLEEKFRMQLADRGTPLGDTPYSDEVWSLFIERRLGLIVSEVSEALDVLRKEGLPVEDTTEQDMFLEELADAIIRLLDLAEWVAPGKIEDAVLTKHEKNAGRPYRHNRRF